MAEEKTEKVDNEVEEENMDEKLTPEQIDELIPKDIEDIKQPKIVEIETEKEKELEEENVTILIYYLIYFIQNCLKYLFRNNLIWYMKYFYVFLLLKSSQLLKKLNKLYLPLLNLLKYQLLSKKIKSFYQLLQMKQMSLKKIQILLKFLTRLKK